MSFELERVNESLQRVVGLTFHEIGRFESMATLGFGDEVPLTTTDGGPARTGRAYALHIQCPFRLLQGNRIVLGSEDLYRRLPEGSPPSADREQEYAYDRGAEVVEGVLSRAKPRILSIAVAEIGDLRIELEQAIRVQVFPATPSRHEAWRFLLPRFGHDDVVFPWARKAP
ncbi:MULTISPECIES: hypothetical protein [unclassified Embleya]|uniref:hypothetical protein n=1 Tax=unclassified Embleya TaxID=2699296 RepID=UPI00340EF2BB